MLAVVDFFFFWSYTSVVQVIKARFWCSGKIVKCQVFIVGAKYFVSLMQSVFCSALVEENCFRVPLRPPPLILLFFFSCLFQRRESLGLMRQFSQLWVYNITMLQYGFPHGTHNSALL